MACQAQGRNAAFRMHRLAQSVRALAAAVVCVFVAFRSSSAQTSIETPTPFDSARRVIAITPSLAERLRLAAPVWPVAGDFRDARLYAVQPDGGFVLAVQRPGGTIERFRLSESQRSALGTAIDAAMIVAGHPTAEPGADVVSEPAGNAFARRQTILAALVYGPLAASLASDGASAGALYLLVTGGTFFATYGGAQSSGLTRAQNELGGDLGLAGAAGGYLAGYAINGNSDKGTRALALGGALAGTIAGISLGRGLTDAEAHSASAGVRSAGLLTWVGSKALGASNRGAAGSVAASEVVGFPLGLAYARRASYTVTAGDVEATGTAGLIGALYGATFAGDLQHPSHGQYAWLGASYVGGLLIGDRLISRQFDLTQSQSSIGELGALAGGLIGLALPVLMDSHSNGVRYGAAAAGATLGMWAVIAESNPLPEGAPRRRQSSLDRANGHLAFGVTLHTVNVGFQFTP